MSLWALCAFTTMVKAEEVDYTNAIVNADLSTTDAWNTEGTKGISGGMVKVGSQAVYDFSQTITLPAGQYRVTAKAVYRYGDNEQAEYNAIQAGTDTHKAKLYAETATKKYEANIQNRNEGASDTDYAAGNGSVTINGKYVPNSSAAVQAWFDAGQYANELVFNVQEEGQVKIGITTVDGIAGDYGNIGAWTLTRLGDAVAEEESGEVSIDVTDKVGTSRDAWHATGGPVTIDGISMPEKYEETTATQGDMLWQTVEGLDNGTYTVELWANARYTPNRGFESAATDGQLDCTFLFANNVEISIPVVFNANLNNNTSHVLVGVEVTDGTLTMGMTKKADGSNWHTIQIKKLTYHVSGDAALMDAKADLLSVIEIARAVSPSTDALTEAIATAESIYANSTDLVEVTAAIAPLQAAVLLANRTNALVGATPENPILTDFVVNGTFDSSTDPWVCTTNAVNKALASNQQGAFNVPFFENWNPTSFTGKIYQVIENIPNGIYELKICAFVSVFDASAQHVYANQDQQPLTAGEPTAYTVQTLVSGNRIEVGFEQTAAVAEWVGIDNVSLSYLGEVDIDVYLEAYRETKALAEALVVKSMSAEALSGLQAALNLSVDETSLSSISTATAALQKAMSVAEASVAKYASNKVAIDAMFTLLENTNVYTAEAYATYSAKAEDFLAQYEAGTLTATVDNPAAIHGWRANVDYDDLLLSAFGVKDFDTNLYINTWSIEGETDGSEFKVPFFEYWTGDDQSLGATTKTATVTGLEPGTVYALEAWVRTRAKNGVAAAEATGITLTIGDGDTVDVTEGAVVGESQFTHAVYTAYGAADENGNLTINFNVLDGNNISWLSFKNLKYSKACSFADGHLTVWKDFDYSSSSEYPWHSLRSEITSVEVMDGVTSIGDLAFSGCGSLTSITIPESVTSIGEWAFSGCGSLTAINIPDGVTSIGDGAFSVCGSLTAITLPEGVTSIGHSAFVGCLSLKDVTSLAATAPVLGDKAFAGIAYGAEMHYPAGSNYYSWLPYFSTCYLKNVGSGTYLQAGASWDARATLGEKGLDVKIIPLENGYFLIETGVINGLDLYYLGTDGYTDAPEAQWEMQDLGDGHFAFTADGVNYLGYDGSEVVSLTLTDPANANAQWQLVSKEDRMTELASATSGSPMDATFLLPGATFGRNDARNKLWEGTPRIDGYESSAATNHCAEVFDTSTVDVHQELVGMLNGYYLVSAQGYYRMGGDIDATGAAIANRAAGTEELNAYLYANDKETPLMSILEEAQDTAFIKGRYYETPYGFVPDDINTAAEAFANGKYRHNLWVRVTDGTLRIGVKKEVESAYDWAVFDNFKLTYYGATLSAEAVGGVNPADYPEDQLFAIMNVTGLNYLTANSGITIDSRDATNTNQCFYFVPTETAGQYHLKSFGGKYVKSDHGNTWSMTAATTSSANTLHQLVAVEDGAYTIGMVGKGKVIGTDNITNGSATYSDKSAAANGKWFIIPVTYGLSPMLRSTLVEANAITGAMYVGAADELAAAIAAGEGALALEQNDTIEGAYLRLLAAMEVARASIDEYKGMPAVIESYKAWLKAGANGYDTYAAAIAAAEEGYTNGTIVGAVDQDLKPALTTFLAANEVAGIVNGTFGDANKVSLAGWTNGVGEMATGKHNNWTNVNDGFAEKWGGSTSTPLMDLDFYQEIEGLPAATYTFAVYAVACLQSANDTYEVSGVKVYANNDSVEVHTINVDRNAVNKAIGAELVLVEVTLAEGETLKVGMSVKNTDANWVVMDNAKLYCFDYARLMQAAIDYARHLIAENPAVNGVALATLQSELAAADDLEALKAATAAFEEAIPSYNKLADMVAEYKDVEALASAIAAANSVLTSATGVVAEVDEAYVALEEAVFQYRFAVASLTYPCDITSRYVANPLMEEGTAGAGWEGNMGYQAATYTNGDAFVSKFIEKWVPAGNALGYVNASQVISEIPNGIYRLSADLIATRQNAGDVIDENNGFYLFANEDSVAVSTKNGQPLHFEVYTDVKGNTITVGAGGDAVQANWVAFDNVKLEYLGGYTSGDVNSDEKHTMNDVVMTVNAVLERPSEKFHPYAADVNDDDVIAMGDVVNILQMVLTDGMDVVSYARSRARLAAQPGTLALMAAEATLTMGVDCMVPVALNNAGAYSAFQVDLQLPEGVELIDVALTDRAMSTHTIAWNTLRNGKVRVIAYSASNAAITGNEGNLINLVVKADAAMADEAVMTLAEGIFVTTDGAEHAVADVNVAMRTKTTDIENVSEGTFKVHGVAGAIIVESAETVTVEIYTVAGQLVQSVSATAGKHVITVPAGVYVVNNNKVIVK